MMQKNKAELPRREFGKLALAGAAGLCLGESLTGAPGAKIDSTFNGVQVGVQSYSFRDRSLEAMIEAMVEIGCGLCELGSNHTERGKGSPRGAGREQLRQWRLSVPLEEFEAIGKKIREAGIDLCAYSFAFRDDCTDAEIERAFEMGKALGVDVLTSSANISTVKRIDPFARKYKMRVGLHNHSNIRPNELATPEDFDAARKGMSDYIGINLDLGHFVAAGFDPLDYMEKHHDDIIVVHVKDRKKNQGANVPLGEGDTPVREALLMLRDNKYPIPANIEYEYKGADTLVEVRRCFEYCKNVLLG